LVALDLNKMLDFIFGLFTTSLVEF